MQHILKSFLKRLTNLTAHNKSLLLLRLSGEQFFDLHELDFLLNRPSFDLIAQLIAQKSPVSLCDVQDSRLAKANEASKKLRKIARTEQFIAEERGARDLYVGYPFVRGKLSDGTLVNAPLVFFPVSLQTSAAPSPAGPGKGLKWTLHRREEPVALNRSFLLAYAHFNRVRLPDELLERNLEELAAGTESRDSLVFRTQLYELLKSSPLEIHFNQALFTDQLQTFSPFRKEELEVSERNGELKLHPEAVLGIFPQAGSYLVPDYELLIERLAETTNRSAVDDLPLFVLPKEGSSLPENHDLPLPPLSYPSEPSGLDALFDRLATSPQPVREEHTFTAFAMDATQERALHMVKQGRSVVVQGPPGTGKSQLICNLISDFTARGKRVLLVCQKRAALDVVYERLKEVNMADFVALIHDFQNDRRALYAQLDAQLEKVDAYRLRNGSLDAIFLERTFAQEGRQIDRLAEELQEFRNALFDEEECGLSVKELYLTSDPSQPHLSLKKEHQKFSFLTLADFLSKLRAYAAYAFRLGEAGYLWQERVSFRRFTLSDLAAIEETIRLVPRVAASLAEKTAAMVGTGLTIREALDILKEEKRLSGFVEAVENEEQWFILQRMLKGEFAKPLESSELDELEKKLLKYLKSTLETTLPTDELNGFARMVEDARLVRDSLIGWGYWRLFSPDRQTVRKVAAANGLTLSPEDLPRLAGRVEARLKLEKLLGEIRSYLLAPPTDEVMDAGQYQLVFHNHRQALKASKLVGRSDFLGRNRTLVNQSTWREFGQFTFRFLALLKTIPAYVEQWKTHLTGRQIEQLLAQPAHVEALISVLREDFDLLCEADRIRDSFSHTESEVVEKLLAHDAAAMVAALPATALQPSTAVVNPTSDRIGGGSSKGGPPRPTRNPWGGTENFPLGTTSSSAQRLVESVTALFQNSLRLAWIEHIEEKYPLLRAVSSFKLRQMEKELQDSIRHKQQLSQEILGLKLREQTYRNLEVNRLNNVTTYRELKHQVTKKLRIWPVRKLMSELSDEVFDLVPCWMASPESVSAIFPMPAEDAQPLFDLVIFDEASQCFSENGIPAIYRARQVVITGDSKQLSPSDLYRIRFDDEGEETALEIDSLLDLSAQHLPQVQLKGHYRSRSLDLIDFSNRHFYGDTLQMLPDFREINKREPAIRYVKVEGVWENNANPPEAEAVVNLVEELRRDQPGKSIGIVTFNFKQQTLIQDLLEGKAFE
ncbi:MAG: DUF4011 domain-containing protein, partial [Ferruginibacter sp.]|nr:DUF4011 domain-containing protein [Cytophagales bacterium]